MFIQNSTSFQLFFEILAKLAIQGGEENKEHFLRESLE